MQLSSQIGQRQQQAAPNLVHLRRFHTPCGAFGHLFPLALMPRELRVAASIDSQAGASFEPLQLDGGHPPTTVLAPNRRIVAVGDLHGDLQQTKRALRLAGVLSSDKEHSWIGGTTVLVQVGDILDRGDDEIAILSLLRHLDLQARSKGGAVFQVNGNHETMNVVGEFQHVSPGGFEEAASFVRYCQEQHVGNWQAAFMQWQTASKEWKAKSSAPLGMWLPMWDIVKMQKGAEARTMLFSPGGPLALELARHGVVLKVNEWLFAHGGVLPHHVKYGIERINQEVSNWMSGKQTEMPFIAIKGFDSIVWSRLYSRERYELTHEQITSCAVLESVLAASNSKGLIVGHTPQISGVNCECESRVWRIDVGMSSGILHADPEVLEIIGDQLRVLGGSLKSSSTHS